jgi:uncharacterized protein YggE
MRVCVVAASMAFVQATAFAQQGPLAGGPPVVITSGEAVVRRTPDRAWVTIEAESRAKTPQEAQSMNAAAMVSVLGRLTGVGIAPEAVRTTAIDLQPEFDYADGRQTLRGYVARNALEVRVDALPRLGEIIDMAVESGATRVQGVRFDLRERAAAEREALNLAVADARRRATAAAAGAGLQVDRVIRIEDHRVGTPDTPRPMMALRADAQSDTTPVSPGELEIRAAVTLTATIR